MAVRDGGDQALANRRAPIEAGHFGVGRRLVEEDEARRIHERLDDAAEEPALDRHVSAGLLVGDQAFF